MCSEIGKRIRWSLKELVSNFTKSRQMAPREAGSVTGTKMAHRPSCAGQFTYEKLYAPLSKAIHLPAFFRQACGLHFWNSGGLGSWSHRHRSWPSVLLFSEATQWTVLFWKPPPQDTVHWKRGARGESQNSPPRFLGALRQRCSNPTVIKWVVLLSRFSHAQLCDSMDCSLLGSSVHGILQARIQEWVAMPSSRGTQGLNSHLSNFPALGGRYFTTSATQKDGQVGEASIITSLFEGVIKQKQEWFGDVNLGRV